METSRPGLFWCRFFLRPQNLYSAFFREEASVPNVHEDEGEEEGEGEDEGEEKTNSFNKKKVLN